MRVVQEPIEAAPETREQRLRAAEVKFLVEPSRAADLLSWARDQTTADTHGHGDTGDVYRTTTLYFDTSDFDVFHRRGSFGRAKYRIRRYGNADMIFLERKLRTGRMLAKRRTLISMAELDRADIPPVDRHWAGAWFSQRLVTRRLRPVCQISYERVARVVATPYGEARLTVDTKIQASKLTGLHFVAEAGVPLVPESSIVELKYRFAMPGVFKSVIEEFAIEPTRMSKYRFAVPALGLAPALAASAAGAIARAEG